MGGRGSAGGKGGGFAGIEKETVSDFAETVKPVLFFLQEYIVPDLLHVLILVVNCDFETHIEGI